MGYRTLRKALLIAGLAASGVVMAAKEPPKTITGASGSMLSNTCAGCHGTGGNSNGPATPGLAGLSKGYFIAAMVSYKYGKDQAKIDSIVSKLPIDADEFEALPRTGTIMPRIAKGFSEEEIVKMADYFSKQKFVRHAQKTNSKMVKRGRKLHDKKCEKCHEDGGRTSVDDVGILAGRWMPYLANSLQDFKSKARKMPKKMAKKMKGLSDRDIQALIQYYGSQK